MLAIATNIGAHYILLGISLLLLVCVFASKASEKLGVPALLLFLIIGMLAGSEGPGGIDFDDPTMARLLGTLALSFILFAGGLDSKWPAMKPVLTSGVILATAGVFLTAVSVAFFAVIFMGFSLLEGLLLGSVMSSTDAAAVFSILRSRSVSLKGKLKPLLELESGSNDPMAVFLTITVIGMIQTPETDWWQAIAFFFQQMLVGAGLGVLAGKAGTYLINRIKLEYEGLYSVLTISLVMLIFGISETFGGNGFLAVYLAGIILGNSDFIRKQSLKRFHDGLAWLMQIMMFLTLGLLVFPSRLVPVIGWGLFLSAFLILIARPAAVFLCMAASKFNVREKTLVSWVGLRGAVPIVLATFPLVAGIEKGETIFNLVYFVVLTSVLLQGKGLPSVAKWLKLAKPMDKQIMAPLEFEPTVAGTRTRMAEIRIPENCPANGKRIIDVNFPPQALVVLIYRENRYFVPRGSTVLHEGDILSVLGEPEAIQEVRNLFSGAE